MRYMKTKQNNTITLYSQFFKSFANKFFGSIGNIINFLVETTDFQRKSFNLEIKLCFEDHKIQKMNQTWKYLNLFPEVVQKETESIFILTHRLYLKSGNYHDFVLINQRLVRRCKSTRMFSKILKEDSVKSCKNKIVSSSNKTYRYLSL